MFTSSADVPLGPLCALAEYVSSNELTMDKSRFAWVPSSAPTTLRQRLRRAEPAGETCFPTHSLIPVLHGESSYNDPRCSGWAAGDWTSTLNPESGATYRLTFKLEVADPEATTELEPINVPSCAILWVLNSECSTANRVPKWYG